MWSCFCKTKSNGYIRWATFSDPKTLCPIMSDDSGSSDVIGMLFTGPYKYDKKTNMVPDMATAMPEISKDNLTIKFKIKPGIKWHDGVELTSADIKFSYDLIRDPQVLSPRYADFMSIKNIETPDKYTVIINLKEVDSAFLDNLTNPYIIPKHIWEKADKTKLKEFEAARKPIGNGPYMFKEWKKSERIEVVPFKDYYDGAPKNSGVIYDITPSTATALVKMETQEDNMTQVPESDVARMKTKPFLTVKPYTSTTFDYIVYNIKSPFFSDKRVRQAFTYAINKEAILKGIYKGIGQVAEGSYVPALWCYNPNVKKYPYDLAKAKALLDEAGWKVGPDGIRVKNGKKFEVKILTNQGNKMREKAVVLVQNQLKPLGIKVEPRILDWNTMWSNYIDIGKFDLYYSGFITGITGDQTVMFHSDKTIGSFNRGRYVNPRIDELYTLAKKTFDKNQQKKYFFEAQQIIAEDQPMTFIVYRGRNWTFNKEVTGTEVYNLLGFMNMDKWVVTK
ncbi:ABC transporter substrate-binding protein [Fervidicella metallireducens]|nr:ABC transporter substrate-binding protein [Fervidicella metallireducens]